MPRWAILFLDLKLLQLVWKYQHAFALFDNFVAFQTHNAVYLHQNSFIHQIIDKKKYILFLGFSFLDKFI
jgi:hypothetical protein